MEAVAVSGLESSHDNCDTLINLQSVAEKEEMKRKAKLLNIKLLSSAGIQSDFRIN